MAFLLNGNPLAVDVPFKVGDINYPANWLRLTTKAEKEAIGITEIADPDVYDLRFYWEDGTPRDLDDVNETDKDGNLVKNIDGSQRVKLGVKTILKNEEKQIAKSLLNEYDWQVVRKVEKGTEIDSTIVTYRDGIRTAYTTRKTEIDNCADTNALVTLYGVTTDSDGNQTPNMTQYPQDPN
tara:strand:- start:316 stop:858 length:543 start_codon:yes stop_codon:yes gene_type:complete